MSVKQITTGQDSFLDIVANLVGILIILVVVVSAQATTTWRKPEPKVELVEKLNQLDQQLSKSSDIVSKLQTDNHQIEARIIKENQLAANLTDQRHHMLMQLEIVKRELQKQRDEREKQLELVNQKQREMIQKQNEFTSTKNSLQRQLNEIEKESNAVVARAPKSEVIQHYPNPIAKTVFSDEVHFRLSAGKLSYVPMDELISLMKSEWKVKAEKLNLADRTVETVGPIKNFRMQYELETNVVKEKTQYGFVDRKTVRFKQFLVHPQAGDFGESIDVALGAQSDFQQVLSRYEPRKTTVSIWVYPDSYGEHNQIKDWLHENGFQMASWPLETGRKISGGPQGFKTSAQ